MKFYYLILVFTTLIFQSCDPGTSESKTELTERELLFKEVMNIHDEVMPKMADINRTKRGLKTLAAKETALSDSLKNIIDAQMLELAKAEEAMNNWMRDFDSPKSSAPDKQVIDYLSKEKTRISAVSDVMLKSLEKGNQLLTDLQKQ